jgi:ATP-binding cassette subfamily C (CFTR/MRP) protein 1
MANITITSVNDCFGPFFELPGRQTFDFTLLFEDTILSILPSSLLLAVVPVRIAQLWQASRKVTASHLRTIKIVREEPSLTLKYFI